MSFDIGFKTHEAEPKVVCSNSVHEVTALSEDLKMLTRMLQIPEIRCECKNNTTEDPNFIFGHGLIQDKCVKKHNHG